MKYIFNFENRERPVMFNRERLLLAACQDAEQLYYMMDTQYEGIYQAEAESRRRQYGANSLKTLVKKSGYALMADRKGAIAKACTEMEAQRATVFRRGMHFYNEVENTELVPGDVVFLTRGDLVPADVRIIFARDLEIDQEIYTGQNQAVKKTPAYKASGTNTDVMTSLSNICLMACRVTAGSARGVVINTGTATYLGHLLLM